MAGKTIKLHITDQDKRDIKITELSIWTYKAYIGKRKYVKTLQSYVIQEYPREDNDIKQFNARIAEIVIKQNHLRVAIDEIIADLESSE